MLNVCGKPYHIIANPILRRNDFTFGCFNQLVVVSLVACCHQVAEHECDAKTQSCVQTSDANDVHHPRGTTPRPAAVKSNGVKSLAADILDVVLAEARRKAGTPTGRSIDEL
ncbi:unnamed protein product [Sphagnum troendelagicum]|uniref:Uncharacterized protein n=1 Tax=Sphagnum troendelagicum TaxID=128251 RepID=A0ABP0USS9_9BRYO